jgi:hypothetical protein
VGGPLLWGSNAGAENNAFFNGGTCVAAGKAKKCELADPLTLASKTPPAACTLYLDDGVAPCSAWIPGCSPGARSATGMVVLDSNDTVVGFAGDPSGTSALREDGANIIRIPIAGDGADYLYGSALYFTTNDCTLLNLATQDTQMVKQVNVVSSGSGFIGPATVSNQVIESILNINSSFNNQTDCDTFLGPGKTFIAPHGCCDDVAPFNFPVGPAISVDLSAYTPPFSVDVP